MNEKFFQLPEKKQRAMMDAGFRTFYRFGYRKASMSETAEEAGISKALLFHYFINKKEYFLYLVQYAMQVTLKISRDEISPTETDLFEIFMQSARVKSRLLRDHVFLSRFMMTAYEEKDEEVVEDLKKITSAISSASTINLLNRVDRSKFKKGVDVSQLIQYVIWCGDGYMKEKFYGERLDIDQIEAGYRDLLNFFKHLSYQDQYLTDQVE